MVKPGSYPETINHYNVLRTIEDMYGLPHIGNSATATPILDCWTTSPPVAPSNLTAVAVSSSQINLAWTDNSSDETQFEISRSTNGRSFSVVATVGANVTTFANTGLTRNTKYYFRVRSSNANGFSAYSNVTMTRTPPK
jgi:titin